jgi:NTE family protein
MNMIDKAHQQIQRSLANIPFFRSLPRPTLAAISAKLKLMHYDQGDVVFQESTLGDSMYLIESGQVKVSTGSGSQEKVINYLGPGNFFGEMALLLDQRRSATVTVTIDVDLWVLTKADLDDLLTDHPNIALQLSRELSRRLSDAVTEVKKRPGYSLVTVFGDQPWRLGQKIYEQTRQRVVIFDATGRNLSQQLPASFFQSDNLVLLQGEAGLTSESMVETLGILVDGFDWVLIALSASYDEVNLKAVRLAKATVLLNATAEAWITTHTTGPMLHCDISDDEALARTARKITHRVVGLALSSGGARGIAHIGVLRVLQAANIPIDMIAGTSAGSLFGGLYACGKSIDEIASFAKNLVKLISLKSGLWDPKFSLPWNGLIKGNATLKYLAKQFNDATFTDTKIPFYVVATDVLSGEEVVFEKDEVADAVRASIGMIGIFSPYQHKGHYLIDGGAVNPVPATVLAEKGANIIIASSVIPSIEEERARGRLTAKDHYRPTFLGVLSSMMAIMEREIVKTRMNPVDVLIRPAVEMYTAMDYDRADDFIRLGEEAAKRELPALQKIFGAAGSQHTTEAVVAEAGPVDA